MGAALAFAQADPPRPRQASVRPHLRLVSSTAPEVPADSSASTFQASATVRHLSLVPSPTSSPAFDPLADGEVSQELLSILKSSPQSQDPSGFLKVREGFTVYSYDDYGTPTSSVGSNPHNPYRFQGQQYDDETGLYYMRARYMNPALGKFIQKDPAGYGAGMNLYDFAGNDPVNRSDPNGLSSSDPTNYNGGGYPGFQPYEVAALDPAHNIGLDVLLDLMRSHGIIESTGGWTILDTGERTGGLLLKGAAGEILAIEGIAEATGPALIRAIYSNWADYAAGVNLVKDASFASNWSGASGKTGAANAIGHFWDHQYDGSTGFASLSSYVSAGDRFYTQASAALTNYKTLQGYAPNTTPPSGLFQSDSGNWIFQSDTYRMILSDINGQILSFQKLR